MSEGQAAVLTGEPVRWFHTFMYVLDVFFHAGQLRECRATHRAPVRLLPRMFSLVVLQLSQLQKSRSTLGADVWPHPVLGVSFHVALEIVGQLEAHAADTTGVGSAIQVGLSVVVEGCLEQEPTSTCWALILLLSGMNVLVCGQHVLLGKGRATDFAHVRLGGIVLTHQMKSQLGGKGEAQSALIAVTGEVPVLLPPMLIILPGAVHDCATISAGDLVFR